MRRREIIAAAAPTILWPLRARSQQAALPVIGYLGTGSPEAFAPMLPAFQAGLKQSGYVEGRNVVLTHRWADGRYERLPALAAELVTLKVAVILAPTGLAAITAKKATQSIPIVFLSGDAVALGLVASLSRPGGNATGVSILVPELIPKRLELLRDLIPGARSVALLVNPGTPLSANPLADMQSAARVTGHNLINVEVRSESEIARAFSHLGERRPDALVVPPDPLFFGRHEQVVALAARHAILAIYDRREYAIAGGLISYGPNYRDAFRLLGVYIGKILAGAKPADLPVAQPTRFELVVNQKTAKALGITVPQSLLLRADEVLQ